MNSWLSNYLFVFENFTLFNAIDVGIISLVFYIIFIKVSKTRIMPILQAFMVILFLTFLASIFGFNTTHYILQNMVSLMFLSAIILFPTEIKRGLYRIGHTFFQKYMFYEIDNVVIDNLVKSVETLSKGKVGAIIVLEGNDSLSEIIESGVSLNAQVEKKVILTVFDKKSLLHDGAMVISRNRIQATACFIPHLSSTIDKQKSYGSRHLAALGLSEDTDAYILVVSEQNGKVSIAYKGVLIMGIGRVRLRKMIESYFAILQGEEQNLKKF